MFNKNLPPNNNTNNDDKRLTYRRSQNFNAFSSIYSCTALGSQDQITSLTKPPLPISHEFDLLYSQHHGDPNVDRSNWLQQVLDNHPDIKELRECVNPVARASQFARLYLPSNRMIPHELLLALISQHLRTLGLSEAQASLHSEWGSDFNIPPHKLYSQLALLVQRGVHRAERFWELSIPSIHAPSTMKQTQTALDEEISRTIGAASNVVGENKKLRDVKNILDEKPGDTNYLQKDDQGNITNASLNQLIYYITSSDEDVNSSEIRSALCLTISSYTSSMAFFNKLRDRFMDISKKLDGAKSLAQSSENQTSSEYEKAKLARGRCVNVFKEWIKGAINDIEPQVLDAVKLFVDKEISPIYPKQAQKMFDGKSDTNSNLQIKQFEEKAPCVQLDNIIGLWTGNFSLFDLPLVEFARQLTVWSTTRYYAIQRSELLDCAWNVPRLKYRAPNVIALTDHMNKLSQWVIYSILSENNVNKRIEKMETLIKLGNLLFEMNNYFDGASIILAFIAPQLDNLTLHKARLKQETQDTLTELIEFCQPADNYAPLRKKQTEALNNRNPVMPLISILLQDIFQTSTNAENYVDGLINVLKCKRVYKCIVDLEVFMREKYCFLSIDQVQAKIDQFQDYDENLLFDLAASVEKQLKKDDA